MVTQNWPAWFYGPAGASAVFNSSAEVPAGWQDHPSKVVVTPASSGTTPTPPVQAPLSPADRGAAPVPADASSPGGAPAAGTTEDVANTLDAHGWPWSADLHAATQSKTNAGLWRMKVGVSRPDPKPGYPKPALDL